MPRQLLDDVRKPLDRIRPPLALGTLCRLLKGSAVIQQTPDLSRQPFRPEILLFDTPSAP